jgi:membrane protease YdiL (CAAX protease family)
MNMQMLKYSSTASRIVVLFLLCIVIGFVVLSIGLILMALLSEGNVEQLLTQINQMETQKDILQMKFVQMFTQLGFFVLPSLVFAFLIHKNIFAFYHLNIGPSLKISLLAVLMIVVANPFIEWLIYKNNQIHLPEALSQLEMWMRNAEEAAAVATNKFLQMDGVDDYLLNIFMIGVSAALGEELLFRGAVQPLAIKLFKNHHVGIWIAAALFSTIHLQFYGFFARMFLGVILGYSYYYSKNLWVPIIAHFFNNTIAVSYVYYSKEPLYNTSQGIAQVEEVNVFYALIGFSLVLLGLIIMRYNHKKTLNTPL